MVLSKIVVNLRDNYRSYFGSDSVPEIEVLSTRSYPNSQITQLSVRMGHEGKALFVKLLYPDRVDGRFNKSDREYKKQQIQTENDVLKKLYKAYQAYPDLGVVKPIACFPEFLALVTEEQTGAKFSSIIGNVKLYSSREQFKRLVYWVQLCGWWLHLFQGFMREGYKEKYDFREVFDYCNVRLDILSHHNPGEFTEGFCRRIRHFLEEQVDELKLEDLEIVGGHNDYRPYNMIVSGQKLVLLDFSGFSYGPACCDYVKFWSGLDSIKGSLFVSDERVQRLQEAFAIGYRKTVDLDDAVFKVFRVSYMLDKMGDTCLDWPTIAWLRRPAYKQLYRKYLSWLKKNC